MSDTSEGNLEELIAQQLNEANAVVAAEALAMERAEGRLSAEVDEVLDAIEAEIDIDARRIHQDQWLVMAEPKVFDELADEGYIFDEFTELARFGSSTSGGRCSCKLRYLNNPRWHYGCCGIRSG